MINKNYFASLSEGLNEIERQIKMKLELAGDKPIVMLIAGGTASGKTSAVSTKIKERFGDNAVLFSMDDYYGNTEYLAECGEKGTEPNWDSSRALNFKLCIQHLESLKRSESIIKPVYHFGRKPNTEEILQPCKIIILEGIFALSKELISAADLKVFVDVSHDERLRRRVARDLTRTTETEEHIRGYFQNVVAPAHDELVQPTMEDADIIISNEDKIQ